MKRKSLTMLLVLAMVLSIIPATAYASENCIKHIYDANGKCTACGAIDPLYEGPANDPCAIKHTFENGKCSYCGAADPNYQEPANDPCAIKHTFESGKCIYCGTTDPNYEEPVNDPCAIKHTFVDGKCVYCGTPDPNLENTPNNECKHSGLKDYVDNDTDHTVICQVCGQQWNEAHDFTSGFEANRCVCKHVKKPTDPVNPVEPEVPQEKPTATAKGLDGVPKTGDASMMVFAVALLLGAAALLPLKKRTF